MDWAEFFGTILASSTVAALLTGLLNRRKTAAEARALDGEALNKAAQGYATLIASLTPLTQQQNETARQVAELMNRLAEAEREIHSLRDENNHLRQDIHDLRDENTNLRQDIHDLRDENTNLRQDIHGLRDENTNLRQEIARLQALLLKVGIDPHTGECVERRVNL